MEVCSQIFSIPFHYISSVPHERRCKIFGAKVCASHRFAFSSYHVHRISPSVALSCGALLYVYQNPHRFFAPDTPPHRFAYLGYQVVQLHSYNWRMCTAGATQMSCEARGASSELVRCTPYHLVHLIHPIPLLSNRRFDNLIHRRLAKLNDEPGV